MLVPGSFPATGSGKCPGMLHQQPSLFPANGIQSASQQYIPSVGGASSNQLWNLPHTPNAQVQPNNPATQAPQDVSRSNHNVSTIASQLSAGDVKSIGRSKLPAFPPMASSQGALPNERPSSSVVRTSSLGCHTWHPHIHLDCLSSTTICITNASKWATNS